MDVTRDDLRDLRDAIVGEMRAGFEGTHERLNLVNGRVGKVEAATAAHEAKISTLNREVFHRRASDAAPPVDPAYITKRDLYVAVGLLTALGALVTWVINVANFAEHAVR